MKSKVLAALLALSLALTMAACHSDKEETTETATDTTVTETTAAKTTASDKTAEKTTASDEKVEKISGTVASKDWIKTYTAEDESTVTIKEDGSVNVSIIRLCDMDGKVTGVNGKGVIGMDLVDPNGNTLYAEMNADTGTWVVMDSTWEYLPNGEVVEFNN